MTTFRNDLLTRMIHIYGFEHEVVLNFARLCEEWENDIAHDRTLETLVEAHEEFPQIGEEEED